MVLKRSVAAAALFIKRFFNDIFEVNWNDHLLSEIGTVHAKRYEFHAEDSEF